MAGNSAITVTLGGTIALRNTPSARTSVAGITIAAGAPNSRYADTAMVGVSAAIMSQPSANTSALGVTVAYTVGAPEVFTSRAWGFSLDGHPFYVLHLGKQGTFVYDLSTQQWSQFQTAGFATWNMEYGVSWNNYIIGGSIVDGSLWYLNEDAFVDEDFRAITRVVTGGIAQRGRKALTNFAVSVNGAVEDIDEDSDSSIMLEISDDNGANWINAGSIPLSPDTPKQELNWYGGLGMITAPGRIYRFTDTGSLRRIDDATADIEGEDEENPDNT